MPARTKGTTKPPAPPTRGARRTARPHKPTRRSIDAGLKLAPTRKAMNAQQELQEPQNMTSPTRRRRRMCSRDTDQDHKTEKDKSVRPQKRPRTAVIRDPSDNGNGVPRVSQPKINGPSLSPDVPILKLWNERSMKLLPAEVALCDLCGVLANNEDLSLYTGQSNHDFPDNLCGSMVPQEDITSWRRELSKPGTQRRVMIFDPVNLAVVAYEKSPTVPDLETFIRKAIKHEPPENHLRVYAAEYTSFHGLSDEVSVYVGNMSRRPLSRRGSALASSEDTANKLKGETHHVERDRLSPRYARSERMSSVNQNFSWLDCKNESIRRSSEWANKCASQELSNSSIASLRGDGLLPFQCDSDDDTAVRSLTVFKDIFEAEAAEAERIFRATLPPFRSMISESVVDSMVSSASEEVISVQTDSSDPVMSSRNAENSMTRVRWKLDESSCSSDDILSQSVTPCSPEETNSGSYCFQNEEEEVEGIGARVPAQAQLTINRIRREASAGMEEEEGRMRGPPRHDATALRSNEAFRSRGELSQVPKGQQKDPVCERKKFRTNPVGPEEGPLESEPYSKHVYLWNYDEKTRSDVLMPLKDAITACRSSVTPLLGIYDGQDYNFENGPHSWRIHMFPYDVDKWAKRGRGGDIKKVRVWNRSQRSFRAYQFCPTLSGLILWLRQHPDNAIFEPSSIDPTYAALCQASSSPSLYLLSSSAPRPSAMLWNRVMRRIRRLGVSEVHTDSLNGLEFWNAAKSCREKRKPFGTRTELARFLLANPWIEVHRDQEEIEEFELASGFRLTPIFTNCPAELACFWDKQSGKKHVQPRDDPEFKDRTIYECLSRSNTLELYLGQDTTCFKALSNAIVRHQRSGSYPYQYMLAYSGDRAREFLSQGWAALHIDVSKRSTGCAVFWNKKEKSLQMQPDLAAFLSINDYLERQADTTELYTGQDLVNDVTEDLSKWFRLLTYKPGYSSSSQRPMITKPVFLPVSGVLRDGFGGHHFKPSDRSGARSRNIKLKNDVPSPRACIEEEKLNQQYRNEGRALSKRVSQSTEAVDTRTSSNKEDLPGEPSVDLKETTEPSLDTTNCSNENLHGSTEVPCSQTPDSCVFNDQDAYQDGLENNLPRDDRNLQAEASNETSYAAYVEVPLSRTREKANRVSNLIKEAGPKILNRQLKQDVRQALREDLLLDVDSSKTLLAIARRLRSSDFVSAAGDLCARLEALDLQDCFSNIAEFAYGPPDLLSMRAELESGKIHTIAGVSQKFRLICEDLIQFHQHGALLNEARLLKHYGEQTISEFTSEYQHLVLEEERISRIATICEKARKIGFQQNGGRRKARKSSRLTSPVKAKPSIQMPGYQSDVTFLNCRDEKGYSVMGKRHSARVFGLSIDMRTCEAQAGNLRPCHVCDCEIFQSDGDALQCANHALGLCEEIVCRNCLETVFAINEKEFGEWRTSDDWICVHCRGLCVRKGSREASHCSFSDRDWPVPEANMQFVWPHDTNAHSISITVAVRSMSGSFESWQEGMTINLAQERSQLAWYATAKLSVGTYRCQVCTDGVWTFSTTFQVFPETRYRGQRSARDRQSAAALSKIRSGAGTKGACACGRQQIEWKIAKQTRKYSERVHSFSRADGGAFVQKCSRTEGYDWRRSKRHAVVQWIPEKPGRMSAESFDREGQQIQVVRLSASTKRVSGAFQRSDFPRLQVGMSWRQFKQEVNAFKFDYMRNETLWGIVTGTSRIHGIGLFTLTGYQKGDFVIEYAGDLIRTPLGDIREKRYEAEGLGTYLFKIDEHQIVDATVNSNRARFTNHSCDPNMAAKIVNVRGRDLVVLLATRNIPPFAELTFNYQLPYEDKKLECLCNSWNCVGVMN